MTIAEGIIRIYKISHCHQCGRKILRSDWSPNWIHEYSLTEECTIKRPTADPGGNEVELVDIIEEVIQ